MTEQKTKHSKWDYLLVWPVILDEEYVTLATGEYQDDYCRFSHSPGYFPERRRALLSSSGAVGGPASE